MRFDPTLAAVRFGSGRSPIIGPPANADAILAEIDDAFAFVSPGYSDVEPSIRCHNSVFDLETISWVLDNS